MPFPSEHVARLIVPAGYENFRREKDRGGEGVDFIIAVKQGISALVSIRFDKDLWSVDAAEAWLKDSGKEVLQFEPAGRNDEDDKDFERVARFDVGEIREDGYTRTDEGYIVADAVVSRIGVFKYRNPDGTTRSELRHPDQVCRSDSLATMKLKPLTDGHPPTRLLNTSTAQRFQVGTVGENVRSDSGLIKANVTVTDSKAIDAVESRGRKYLSCGYTCDLVPEVGVYEGERYDHVQTNVRYNHVALCNEPRAGKVARITVDHLDSLDAEIVDSINNDEVVLNQYKPRKGRFMSKKRLDGIDYDADQQVINALEKAEKEVVNLSTKLDEAEKEIEALKGQFDTAKARVDELEAVNMDELVSEAVKARTEFLSKVSPHLDEADKANLDSASESDIKVKIIKKKFPEANLDEKSEAYIEARFDSALELLNAGPKPKPCINNQYKAINGDSSQGSGDRLDSLSAREKMIERSRSGWERN